MRHEIVPASVEKARRYLMRPDPAFTESLALPGRPPRSARDGRELSQWLNFKSDIWQNAR
jgi:hypothetical protein